VKSRFSKEEFTRLLRFVENINEERILGIYLNEIKYGFGVVSRGNQKYILRQLDSLVQTMYNKQNILFDPVTVKEIRKKSGLSLTKLAEKLDIKNKNSARQIIYTYETGAHRPKNPPQGETSIKYLAWLKEQDYNPFNL